MKVIKLTYNWRPTSDPGYDFENYSTAEVNKEHYSEKKIVKEIKQYSDEMGKYEYLIIFEDNSTLRVYNPNQVWYEKEG